MTSAPWLKEVINPDPSTVTIPSAIEPIKVSNQAFCLESSCSERCVLMRLSSNALARVDTSSGADGTAMGRIRSPWLMRRADSVSRRNGRMSLAA